MNNTNRQHYADAVQNYEEAKEMLVMKKPKYVLLSVRHALESITAEMCTRCGIDLYDADGIVSLFKRIESLIENELLTETEAELLHRIRKFGNEGSHNSLDRDAPSMDEAVEAVDLLNEAIKLLSDKHDDFEFVVRAYENNVPMRNPDYYSPNRRYYGKWCYCNSRESLVVCPDYIKLKEKADHGDISAMLDIAVGFLPKQIAWSSAGLVCMPMRRDKMGNEYYENTAYDARYYYWIIKASYQAQRNLIEGKEVPYKYLATAVLETVKFHLHFLTPLYSNYISGQEKINGEIHLLHRDQYQMVASMFGESLENSLDIYLTTACLETLFRMIEETNDFSIISAVHQENDMMRLKYLACCWWCVCETDHKAGLLIKPLIQEYLISSEDAHTRDPKKILRKYISDPVCKQTYLLTQQILDYERDMARKPIFTRMKLAASIPDPDLPELAGINEIARFNTAMAILLFFICFGAIYYGAYSVAWLGILALVPGVIIGLLMGMWVGSLFAGLVYSWYASKSIADPIMRLSWTVKYSSKYMRRKLKWVYQNASLETDIIAAMKRSAQEKTKKMFQFIWKNKVAFLVVAASLILFAVIGNVIENGNQNSDEAYLESTSDVHMEHTDANADTPKPTDANNVGTSSEFQSDPTSAATDNLISIDVFEDLDIKIDARYPDNYIRIANRSENAFVQNISFSASKENEIREGDIITIYAEYDRSEAHDAGYRVIRDEMEYTATGVRYYASSESDITDQAKQDLVNDATRLVDRYFHDNNYRSIFTDAGSIALPDSVILNYTACEFDTAYFLKVKENAKLRDPHLTDNYCIIVMRVPISTNDNDTAVDSGYVYLSSTYMDLIAGKDYTDIWFCEWLSGPSYDKASLLEQYSANYTCQEMHFEAFHTGSPSAGNPGYIDNLNACLSAWMADRDFVSALKELNNARGKIESEKYMELVKKIQMIFSSHSIAAGRYYSALIQSNGTVDICGQSTKQPCDTSGWNDIVSISIGDYFIAGLRSDGTVVADGPREYYDGISKWTDVIVLTAGDDHIVGLKADGTLISAGHNTYGQCNVDNLYGEREIVSITAGYEHTVALYADGTVSAIGRNDNGQCNVSTWTDVIAISAGSEHTIGLKADGTVYSTGLNSDGQCNTQTWADISTISAGDYFSMGLREDGSVVVTGQNNYGQHNTSAWMNVTEVAAGNAQALGLCGDGRVLCAGLERLGYLIKD